MGTKISGPYKGFKFNLEAKNALPAPITSLSATAIDFANVQLVFANVLNAVSYQYSVNGGEWTALGGTKIVSGLTGETAYAFRVRGVGVKGNGPESPVANATTLSQLPAQITDLVVTIIDTTSAQMTFANAARALSYEYTINGGSTWTAVPGNKIITGLWPSTTYGVQVRGVNAAGNGPGSNVASITTSATIAYYGFSSAASDKTSTVSVANMYAPTTSTTGSWQTARSLVGKTSSQKGYFEVRATGAFSGDLMVALGGITTAISGGHPAQQSGTGGIGYYSNGTVISQGTTVASGIGFYGSGDTIMVAFNGTKVWFGKNGVWASSSNPATNTGGYAVPTNVGTLFPMVSTFVSSGTPTFNVNFGQSAFTYTVPSGFDTWNVTSYPTSFGPESKATNISLSNYNLTISSVGGWNTALARSPRTSGKFYFEHVAATNCMIGLAPATAAASLGSDMRTLNGFNVYPGDATIRVGQTTLLTQTIAVGTKIGIAWDGVKAYVRLNGVWVDGSDPATGTGGYAFAATAGVGVHAAISSSGTTGTVNFGATPFDYAIPAGFAPWTVAAAPVEIVDLTARGITSTSVQLAFTPLGTAQSYDYTLNNGTSWGALTKNLAIPGLTANTNYSSIKVRGVNTFSGLASFPASATTLTAQTYPVFTTSTADTVNTGILLTTLRLRLPAANTNYNARAPYGKLPTENGYFEVLAETAGGSAYIGLAGIAESLANEIAQAGSTAVAYGSAGNIKSNGVNLSTGNGAYGAAGQILMVAYKNGKVWFGVDGVWKNGDPATGTGGATLPTLSAYFPMASIRGSNTAPIWGFNFGATAFTYPVPAGILPWNSSLVPTSFNPALKHADITLSNNNLTATNSASTAVWRSALARGGKKSGKFYFECTVKDMVYWGLVPATHDLTTNLATATNGVFLANNGTFYVNGSIVNSNSYPNGTKVGIAWSGTRVYVSYDGVWYNGSDPANDIGGWFFTGGGVAQHAAVSVRTNGTTATPNLGSDAFEYSVPAGFTGWTFAG